MNSNPATNEAAWKGWALEGFTPDFRLLANGVNRIATSIGTDTDWHTMSLVRSASTTTMYIDGTSRATTSLGSTGNALVLGASFNATYSDFVHGQVKNLVIYHSALTNGNRLSVESWAGI
jgi:hypothetical protein